MIERLTNTPVWIDQKKVLVIMAHPDDPEFFCGASIARWINEGHLVNYCLITCGDKGTKDRDMKVEELCIKRQSEQKDAAEFLGVDTVQFLGYPDGYLVPDLDLRCSITKVIRKERPDIVVTYDPLTLYVGDERLNHPDHRAAGMVVLDAVFPTARDHLFFPELLREGFEPHIVSEVWICGTLNPNIILDVTMFWELKIAAIQKHVSQIKDPSLLEERIRNRRSPDSTVENPIYEESFRRIVFQ